MDIELKRVDNQKFKIPICDWIFYLNFADWYGWNPKGTLPPEIYNKKETWSGKYDSNEGQMVSAQDSKSLAIALQAAIDDRSYELKLEDVYFPLLRPLREKFNFKPSSEFDPFEIKSNIIKFISFFKDSEFYIT